MSVNDQYQEEFAGSVVHSVCSPLIATGNGEYEVAGRCGNGNRCTGNRDYCPWIKCRVVVTVMVFLGLVNVYALRVNLSMAVVVMANNTGGQQHFKTIGKSKIYNWSEFEQGWLLGAFFCGYVFTQIPGGWLAQKYGAKHVFGIGVLMTAILTLLTPAAAQLSVWALVVVRVFEGIFEGVTFPSVIALFSVWAPPNERSRFVAFAYSGQFLGSFISFPVTALLCVYGFDGGWPSAFYIFGAAGIVWFVFWLFLAYSSPASHPRISHAERVYIETSIAEASMTSNKNEQVSIPWLQIITSPAVWAVIVAHFCNCFGFFILLTTAPTYFAQALGFNMGKDIVMNGLYSSMAYAVQLVIGLFTGPLADFIVARYLSVTTIRKLFTCTALVTAAVFILLAGCFGSIRLLAIALVTIASGASPLNLGGYQVSCIEMAPRFAGVLMGVTNMAGALPGIIGPVIAKAIAHSTDAPRSVYIDEWREVFIITAEVYLFGAAIFAILGDNTKQWWADGNGKKRLEKRRI